MCFCANVFENARTMKLTHKAMKKVPSLKAIFKSLPNNEFECKGCGKIHKKNW